jgi:hypothetical protein
MNERHRKVSAAGFAKLSQWVKDLDVKTLTASEGIRLFEAFVRIEQMAAGSYAVDQTEQEQEQQPQKIQTLADLLPGIDPTLEEELAQVLLKLSDLDGSGNGQVWNP